jgi:hypothetical protein
VAREWAEVANKFAAKASHRNELRLRRPVPLLPVPPLVLVTLPHVGDLQTDPTDGSTVRNCAVTNAGQRPVTLVRAAPVASETIAVRAKNGSEQAVVNTATVITTAVAPGKPRRMVTEHLAVLKTATNRTRETTT